MRKGRIFLALTFLLGLTNPAFARSLGGPDGIRLSDGYNAGTITAQTGEVAYAGNGSTLTFSGHSVLKPPASVHLASSGTGDLGGGNITIHWTHAATPASTTVKADGTFTATADLASGSIVPLTGALTLTFNSGHAPDNGTNITIDYNTGVQCNFLNTNYCWYTCNVGVGNTYTIFNPINLPPNGSVTIGAVNGGTCVANNDWDTHFFGRSRNTQSNLSQIQLDNYGWQNCLDPFGNPTSLVGWSDGTNVNFPSACGPYGVFSNTQVGVGDFYGDMFFHSHLVFGGGSAILTCGTSANCAGPNSSCSGSGAPFTCCTGSGVGTCGTIGACNGAKAGYATGITDSTAVSAEGQNAAGGSTNNALVYCNGTAWKAF